jgi:hypothetical protein
MAKGTLVLSSSLVELNSKNTTSGPTTTLSSSMFDSII